MGTRLRYRLTAAAATALVATAMVATVLTAPASATTVGPAQPVVGTDLLQAITCPTATTCVAVGSFLSPPPAQQSGAVVSIVNGVPGPAQLVPGASGLLLTGVGCTSATTCYAVGQGRLVPITNGVPSAPTSLGFSASSIACSNATTCVAVGDANVVSIVNGVPGATQPIAGVDQLLGVACPNATTCYAVGTFTPDPINDPFTTLGVVVPITNGVAGPAQNAPGSSALQAIACQNATTCTAVGAGSFFFIPGVVTIVNGVPQPAKEITNDFIQFLGVGCTATTCEGVGFYNGASGVVPIVNGTPGTIQSVPGATGLYAADCPTTALCEAVGGMGAFPDAQGSLVLITVGAGSTLTCTPETTGGGAPVMKCDATAPDGLRSIRATSTTSGGSPSSFSQKCGTGSTTGTLTFPRTGNDRYKVTITDCEKPGAVNVYQVRPDGSATLIKATG